MNRRPISCLSLFLMMGLFLCLFLIQKNVITLPQEDKILAADPQFEDGQFITAAGVISNKEMKEEQQIIYLSNASVISNQVQINHISLILYLESTTNLSIGNSIQVTGNCYQFQNPTNPGEFNQALYYKSLGIDYRMYTSYVQVINTKVNEGKEFLFQVRTRCSEMLSKLADEKEAGVLKAMLLGDKTALDEEIKSLYQEQGIGHILAISGLHISLIGYAIYQLLRKLGASIVISGCISLVLLLPYAILTGFSVSTFRAFLMFGIAIGAQMIGRTYDMLTATSVAFLILIFQNVYLLLNPGFLLSFGAVLGIGLVGACLQPLLKSKHKLLQTILMSFSINLMTFPLILYYYFQFPMYSIFLNLLILPLMAVVILSGMLGCLLGMIHIALGTFFIGTGCMILRLYEWLCQFFQKLPFDSIVLGRPNLIQILIYYFLLVIMLVVLKRKKKKQVLILLPIMIFCVSIHFWNGFYAVFMDVGQGDGIFLRTDSGTTYLIDGGSTTKTDVGTYVILPCIKSLGIIKLDYCIMTHSDYDHISGLQELLQSDYPIGHLVLPNTSLREDAYLELVSLAEAKGIPVIYLSKGDVIKDQTTTFTCLHPYAAFEPESANAYSTVLHMEYGEFDLLLTGDVEGEGETEITNILETEDTSYEVLKVAHHGSRNSSTEAFLEVVHPLLSIISCGKNNQYGHPHEETLERLEEVGSEIYITKEQGAIILRSDGTSFSITGYAINQ